MTAPIPVRYVIIDPQTRYLKQLPYGPGHLRQSFGNFERGEKEFATSEVFSDRRSTLCSGTRKLADTFLNYNITPLWVATDTNFEKGLYTNQSFKNDKDWQKFIHAVGLNHCGLRSSDSIWIKHHPSIFQETYYDRNHPLDLKKSAFAQYLMQHNTKIILASGQFTSLCVSNTLQMGKDHFLCVALTDKMADNLECLDTLSTFAALEPLMNRWQDLKRMQDTVQNGGYIDELSLTARTDFGNPYWHRQRLMEFGPETMEGLIITQSRKVLHLLENNKGSPLTPKLFLEQARRNGTLVEKIDATPTCSLT